VKFAGFVDAQKPDFKPNFTQARNARFQRVHHRKKVYNRSCRYLMLTIRQEQMAVLKAHMLSQNLPELIQQFETVHPAAFLEMGPERSSVFVTAAVKQGLVWGIRKYSDVWGLIALMLDFSLDFASSPANHWARGILNSETLSGTAKVKLAAAHLRGQLDD
jgi:hypothetical protein